MALLADLVLLHPPSIHDFKKRTVALGPISDVVPSSPIFESYPIGFLSILSFLGKHGYKVKISNVALKMLTNRNFNLHREIKSHNPLAFGIDIHWLAHAEGGLEIAKTVKNIHPNTPIVIGGLSASYYHLELVSNYPHIDFVIRGDTVEEPLLKLIRCIENGRQPEDVPNVTWKTMNGRVKANPLSFVPNSLDDYILDYGLVIKAAARDLDPTGYLQYSNWFRYPMAAVLPSKGCSYNCVTCGGSKFAYQNLCNRTSMALKKPETLVEEIRIIGDYMKGPIFILNDLRNCGRNYAEKLFDRLRQEKIDNPLVVEIFNPADKGFLEQLIKVSPDASVEISPESHDEKIRRKFGRIYGNFELEKTLQILNQLGFKRIDVFFMIGLPEQDQTSVTETVHYMEKLIRLSGDKGALHPFIAPLAPFLDPGSIVFENPEAYGYRLFYRTVKEHVEALKKPSWKYFLNYQTEWLTRDEIVKATYRAAGLLNEAKSKYGLISESEGEIIAERLRIAQETTLKIDEIFFGFEGEVLEAKLMKLNEDVERAYEGLLCSKKELLTWPQKSNFNVRLRILYALAKNCLKCILS